MKNLLANVCRRLSGSGGEAASIFRLDTQFGGGKTHGLIALVHAAKGAPNIAEFIDPALLPTGNVRVAIFDAVYLRKIKTTSGAGDQLSAFLSSLFKAVESTPKAALVYTLALGKDTRSSDAYSNENQLVASRISEIASVSARKATC